MNELLQPGQTVYTQFSHLPCRVEQCLGSGGQGEVYQASLSGQSVALKWYFPHYQIHDPGLRARLEEAIKTGFPSERFLWPLELVLSPDLDGFGYVMPLRRAGSVGIVALMKGQVSPSFRALATAGFELADSFFQLHARGFCYRDISFGNIFFEPETGRILICDNDNVGINNAELTGVLGTPRFMAPEIVRGAAKPSTQTDLFSLAVLLFYLFLVHHPLEGQQEAEIRCFDLPAMTRIYGTDAVFIFDPDNTANRPIPGYQDNPLVFWPIYPEFLRELFIKSFTRGIHNPTSGRIQETEWRSAMVRLRDAIFYCASCGAENFYDPQSTSTSCWDCQAQLHLPPSLHLPQSVVMLNHRTHLYPHHLDAHQRYNFSQPAASVVQNPAHPQIWGLKNCSDQIWAVTTAEGTLKEVAPGRSITIAVGTKINFGKQTGEIRLSDRL